MEEEREVYRVLMEKPRRRWEDEIRMDLMEIGWRNVHWIQLAHERGRWRFLAPWSELVS
jgi:hypothetical protein